MYVVRSSVSSSTYSRYLLLIVHSSGTVKSLFFGKKSSDKVELGASCWSHVDGMQSEPRTLPSTNRRSAAFELTTSQRNSDVSIHLITG